MIKSMQSTQALVPIPGIVRMHPRTKIMPERDQSIDKTKRNLGPWRGIDAKRFQPALHDSDSVPNGFAETYPPVGSSR
jgi:hypothetical protein